MLLRRTIRFGDKRAAEAMTPRVDVVALRATATVAELLEASRQTGRTRFPVYEETLDLVDRRGRRARRAGRAAGRAGVAPRSASVAREPVFVPE